MRNRFDGDAGSVVMAGAVHGDITVNFPQSHRRAAWCQVPTAPKPYINMTRQLRKLDEWFAAGVDGPRVALVRGAPGSGRTSLVNHWVHKHRADYPDGLFFVRLAAGPDDAEREGTALRELLLATEHTPDEIPISLDGRAAWWRTWTQDKRIALVIDDALTASQVRSLLPGTGGSAVLVTEAGRLSALLASTTATRVDIDPMSDEAARQLLERIVDDEARVAAEPAAVQRLISLCEGSTIALCVVATMLADFEDRPIARLADKLADDERVLRELSKDDNLSVTVVFDAAYQRLSALARDCYHVLGVHPGAGEVGVDAIAAALGRSRNDVSDAMASLLHAKLVIETEEDRYLMSGLVRQHARAKVTSPEDLLRKLINYYWAHAVTAAKLMLPGRVWHAVLLPAILVSDVDKGTVSEWIRTEHANLCAVVEAAYRLGELTQVCQLCIALWPLHEHGAYSQDMVTVNERGAQAAKALDDHLATSVLEVQLAMAYRQRGDSDRAAELLAEAGEAAKRAGNADAEATALETLGLVRLDQDDLAEAAGLLGRNLVMAMEIGNDRRIALARFHLAKVQPHDEALPLLARAAEGLADEPYNLLKIDLWRGRKLAEAGRFGQAEGLLERVAADAAENAWHRERGEAWLALADVASLRGEPVAGRARLREAIEIFRHYGFTRQASSAESRLSPPS